MTFYDDEEELEKESDLKLIKDVLGLDPEAFERFRSNLINGLKAHPGEFWQNLCFALENADTKNSVKLINTWRRECIETEMAWRIFEAKSRALNEG